MTWTNVPKPTGQPWTRQTFQGTQIYDDANITYDQATVFYDSVNTAAWTDVAKPTGNVSITLGPGNATGLIMSPTYPYKRTLTTDQWTKISKPT